MGIRDYPRIRCAKCSTLIHDVLWTRNDHDETLTCRVRCHGETDTMTLSSESLSPEVIDQIRRQEGSAFTAQAPARIK